MGGWLQSRTLDATCQDSTGSSTTLKDLTGQHTMTSEMISKHLDVRGFKVSQAGAVESGLTTSMKRPLIT
jgi:hypothetical protein